MKKVIYLSIIMFLALVFVFIIPTFSNACIFNNYKAGDIDFDGDVDEDDLAIIKDYVDNKEKVLKPAMDVDGSGYINEEDLELMEEGDSSKFAKTGDVNGDGTFDERDIELLREFLEKSKNPFESYDYFENVKLVVMDVNYDLNVTEKDYDVLKSFLDGDIEKLPSTNAIYGDIIPDGVIDIKDVAQLQKHILFTMSRSSIQMQELNSIYGDLNFDGVIDARDLTWLKKCVVKLVKEEEFPIKKYNEDYVLGDIDLDGELTSYDILKMSQYIGGEIEFSNKQLIVADIDGDAQITAYDWLKLMQKVVNIDEVQDVKDIVDDVIIGDINNNGKVESSDMLLISQFVVGKIKFETLREYFAADINQDGVITMEDETLLSKMVVGLNSVRPYAYDILKLNQYLVGLCDLEDLDKNIKTDMNNDGKIEASDLLMLMQFVVSGEATIPKPDVDNLESYLYNYAKDKFYAGIIRGDVDGNGIITSYDTFELLSYINGNYKLNRQQIIAADVNNDGILNQEDVDAILNHVVNVKTINPVCTQENDEKYQKIYENQ